MKETIATIFSGGRSIGKMATLELKDGLFLPGDWSRLSESQKFSIAIKRIRETMTTSFEDVIEEIRGLSQIAFINMNNQLIQFRGLYENSEEIQNLRTAMQLASIASASLSDIVKEIKETYTAREPLPRPPKIIPAFNIYESYKGKLNPKPVYYHIRSNC